MQQANNMRGLKGVSRVSLIKICIISFVGVSFSGGIFAQETLWPNTDWKLSTFNTAKNSKDLNALEKSVILHLNMARANPSKYALDFIKPRSDFFNGKYYKEPNTPDNYLGVRTQEGVATVAETVKALNNTESMPLLKPHEKLALAASKHAKDQSKHNTTGHKGHDGTMPRDRIEREGRWLITMGENIAYGNYLQDNAGREVVVQLLLDDGVPNRGHRTNILNANFKVVGVACESHKTYKAVCVMDFAGGME
jgi:uncharacterized protein YkwD